MARKLASIQQVREIVKHPNADVIEIAKINGWQCVVKIGEFQQGDLGVYFEIDSFLPGEDERFRFLEKQFVSFQEQVGARIRTLKLRGELSQGLLLPLALFPEIQSDEIGTDVTELLKVQKFEYDSASLSEEAIGYFPGQIKDTEQERIQNIPFLEKKGQWEATEKIDGASMTVYMDDHHFGVCSKNVELKENPENPYWITANKLHLKERLRRLGRNLAIQGELAGPGIRKNKYKLSDYRFFLFRIFDIDNKILLSCQERMDLLRQLNDGYENPIETVPHLGFFELPEEVDEILSFSDGKSAVNPNILREGVVFVHMNRSQSFKAINNKFLLKYDE